MANPLANYADVIEYLYGRINYERVHADSYSNRVFKLERMRKFLALIGDPQHRLPVVHIAGTKGKGSTATMTAEILSAAGYRTGLFTSPHISVFEERIRVDGVSISPEPLVDIVNRLIPAIESMDRISDEMSPTYFEIATALAWIHFEDVQVDIAVLEVGLGGRLDATNLCRPEATAITSISYDHTAVLGETLAEIANEKAGIIKRGVPNISGVIAGEARTAIELVCNDRGAPLHQLGEKIRFRKIKQNDRPRERDDDRVPGPEFIQVEVDEQSWNSVPVVLPGDHQVNNAAVAMGIVATLNDRGWKITTSAVERGMSAVRCPLRIEVMGRNPTIVVDAAHNGASAKALVKTLKESFLSKRRLLIFAGTKDKDVQEILSHLLPEFDTIILTRYLNNPRAFDIDAVQAHLRSFNEHSAIVAPNPAEAWKLAVRFAGPDDLICVTGSFFVAAEIRELLVKQQQKPDGETTTGRTCLPLEAARNP